MTAKQRPTVYWAGRLFNSAETNWNETCAKELEALGYEVILPQKEGLNFQRPDKSFNLDALVRDCAQHCKTADIGIFNLDGSDVDSGTAVEAGIRWGYREAANLYLPSIGVRTDFRRNSEDGSTGVNAMFRILDKVILEPEIDVAGLSQKIHEAIQSLLLPE